MESPWRSFLCKNTQLNLSITLSCGQSFRWLPTGQNEWTSVLARRVWKLRQEEGRIFYKVFEPNCEQESKNVSSPQTQFSIKDERGYSTAKKPRETKLETVDKNTDLDSLKHEAILRDYFQLEIDLENLYKTWSKSDQNFKKIASDFVGVRILRQDPVENLFSFICSSNNNISRITGMVQRMCEKYGDFLMDLDGVRYYDFPSLSALSDPQVEQELRQLGFGYRAKFINQSAQYIVKHHNQDWLFGLRKATYNEAHQALCKLPGVGAKVADCVCLMSLAKSEAIPVDTHVWQIAARFYLPNLNKTKSLTSNMYKQIGDHFRMLFGPYAGWAHSVLFSADLKKFQELKLSVSTLVKDVQSKQDEKKGDIQHQKQRLKRETDSSRQTAKGKKRKQT